MDDTFYDGHDELYHHAKFGEDRTMLRDLKKKSSAVVWGRDCRCAPMWKIFSARRYIALTASVKFRIGSPKTARNEQVFLDYFAC